MIKGMTGFGTAKIKRGKTEAVVEIRSQNHRYCDIVHLCQAKINHKEKY